MKIGKSSSNSSNVLESVPCEDVAATKEDEDDEDGKKLISKRTNIIGTAWDPSEDVISFPYLKFLDSNIPRTKRDISKLILTIYDVDGELAPYILRGKVILSDTSALDKVEEFDEVNEGEDVRRDQDSLKNTLNG